MKTKKHILAILIAAIGIFIGLCSLIGCGVYTEITVSPNVTIDYSKYKTFAWLPDDIDTANSPYNNEVVRNNLKNYFGRSFSERGFSVNLDTPDVLLQIVIVNKKKEKEIIYPAYPNSFYYCSYYYCSAYYSPYPYDYYYHHYNTYCYAMGYCQEKLQYVEGSITLNVIDRKQNKPIWSGTAKGDIYDSEYIKEDIHPAVIRIMKKFPVKPIDHHRQTSNADDVFLNGNPSAVK